MDVIEANVKILLKLDKTVLLQKTGFLSTNEAFQLLKALNKVKIIPSILYWDDKIASNDVEKVKLFNQFFQSVFH